ncbi:amidophosphoribosyltransferase-like [Clavelina lepadiformis]|uniref:amidophosphoribosyltransferase-like n=1 Tax=Clavelina lepadiformis TaxID=159417 RepID=UPI0040421F5B
MTSYDHDDKFHDECGVFACIASDSWPTELDVANIISLGLVGLQHRGQESAGIVTSSGNVGERLKIHKGMGLVSHAFTPHVLSQLNGNLGIGHTRYSTHGVSELSNCQPFVVDTQHGRIAVAHNGELVNKGSLRKEILNRGVGLSTGSDSELITQILCHPLDSESKNGGNWPGRLKNLMQQTPSAYSLVLLHGDTIYAARDPYGNRPLCIGRLVVHSGVEGHCSNHHDRHEMTEGWVVTSESCVFQSLGAELVREVLPGEIVKITKNGPMSMAKVPRPDKGSRYPAFCVFEYVYFARPDSIFEGQMVYNVRRRCGEQLAKESPVEADIISTVPESATPAAFGFAKEIGIPYDEVLAKNRYIGRTFIQPSTRLRKLAVAKKFGVLRENVQGKRIVVVDDSIVRGNTMSAIIRMLKEGGATEVHIRIASPPVRNPCYMGINIPTKQELLANRISVAETAKYLGADSVAYLTVEGLLKSVRAGIDTKEILYDDEEDLQRGTVQREPVENGSSGCQCNLSGCSCKETKTNQDMQSRQRIHLSEVGHCVACLTGEYPVPLDW